MDISASGLVKNCLPNLPRVLKTASLSVVGLSRNSRHQDTLTEAIVVASRPILQTPSSLLNAQINCNTDWGVGRPWVSKCSIGRPPEDEMQQPSIDHESEMTMRQAVKFAIEDLDTLKDSHHRDSCHIPDVIDVEAEWTSYQPYTIPISLQSNRTERQRYHDLMRNIGSDSPTMLHFHGGAFCLMDPSTHRWPLSSLAKHSRGRILSVRYRLSPQHIFPSALLDALQSYLALLSPPPDSYHDPVPPSKIVISGDSSGGCLASSLLLLLLTLSKHGVSIVFYGQSIRIPSPPCAGLSLVSPWLDLTRSLPSTIENSRWDIIAPPPLDTSSPPFPPDSIWPTTPPRAETYCTADMVTHPLVSPVAARPENWKGTPPVYTCSGWEGFTDEIEVFARRIYQSRPQAVVRFEAWEGMPHCFMMVPWNRAGRTAMTNWGTFCADAVRHATTSSIPADEQSSLLQRTETGTYTSSLTYKSRSIRLDDLGMTTDGGCGYVRAQPLDDETVDNMMAKGRIWRIGLEEEMVRVWNDNNNSNSNKGVGSIS